MLNVGEVGLSADLHLTKAVMKELTRQRERDREFRNIISEKKGELDEVLRDVGKVSLGDRKKGVEDEVLGDSSVVVFPLAGDSGEVATGEEVAKTRGAMGLISNKHPEFPKCKSFAVPSKDSVSNAQHTQIRRLLSDLTDRVTHLEDENYLRQLEVSLLRRIITSSNIPITPANKAALDIMAAGRPTPLANTPTELETISHLTEDSLPSFVEAAYTEPSILKKLNSSTLI